MIYNTGYGGGSSDQLTATIRLKNPNTSSGMTQSVTVSGLEYYPGTIDAKTGTYRTDIVPIKAGSVIRLFVAAYEGRFATIWLNGLIVKQSKISESCEYNHTVKSSVAIYGDESQNVYLVEI